MVVYADVVFVINFTAAYLLLLLTGKYMVRSKIKKIRLCAASALNAVFAVVIFSRKIPLPLCSALRIISAFIMVFTAFFEQRRHILSQILWLFYLSAMLVAAMTVTALISGRATGVIIRSGTVYFDVPQKIFLPCLAVSFAAVFLLSKTLDKKRSKRLSAVTISYGGKKITVTALFDSGNLLKEPVSGKCVSILEWDEAKKLLDAEYDFDDLISHAGEIKLRAVPHHSLGKRSGIIFAFLADSITLTDENRIIPDTYIGMYGGSLSENNEYNALLNASLL